MNNQGLNPVEVEMGDLKEFGKELGRMLQERLKITVEFNEDVLLLSERSNGRLRPKDVKMEVKHALHHLGLSHEYRVLLDRTVVRIVKVEHKTRHFEKRSTPPNPSQSLPYLFPS